MLASAISKRPCGSLATCKAAASTHSTHTSCVRVVQHAAPGHDPSSSPCYQPGEKVVGKVVSTGRHGSRVQLQHGNFGFLPHKLDPLHLQHSTHTYAPSSYKGRQAGEACWPAVGLVREFQVRLADVAAFSTQTTCLQAQRTLAVHDTAQPAAVHACITEVGV